MTAAAFGLIACKGRVPDTQGLPTFALTSPSFTGDTIPNQFSSCKGQANISPALSWAAPPPRTQSLALMVTDRDSPFGANFVHWLLYNLPPDKGYLPQGIGGQQQLSDGGRQGLNGFDKPGYGGPCPPGHSPHRYVFRLYALDTTLNLPAGASRNDLVDAVHHHVLAYAELTGSFQH